MSERVLRGGAALLKWAVLLAAALYVAVLFVVIALRVSYPFDLEWFEGCSVINVQRVLEGQNLYVKPSVEFVSSFYTPLYFYALAPVCSVLGGGYLPLRLASILSTVVSLLVVFLLVRRETGSALCGLISSGLMASLYARSEAWFDLARVDSLFLVLLLLALYVLRSRTSAAAHALAGLLMALAFLTKQTTLVVAVPVIMGRFMTDRRGALALAATFAGLVGVSSFVLDALSGGWFFFYAFELPPQHQIVRELLVGFWTRDLALPLGVGCAGAVFTLLADLAVGRKDRLIFYAAAAAGLLICAFASRIHSGGGGNTLIPAYVAIAVLFGLGLHAALKLTQGAAAEHRGLVELGLYAACLIQFVSLAYSPIQFVPSREDHEIGRRLLAVTSEAEGEVFVPRHSYLPALVGKRVWADKVPIIDVLRSRAPEAKLALYQSLSQAIASRRFALMILDEDWASDEVLQVERHYERKQMIVPGGSIFWRRREFIYLPKPSAMPSGRSE